MDRNITTQKRRCSGLCPFFVSDAIATACSPLNVFAVYMHCYWAMHSTKSWLRFFITCHLRCCFDHYQSNRARWMLSPADIKEANRTKTTLYWPLINTSFHEEAKKQSASACATLQCSEILSRRKSSGLSQKAPHMIFTFCQGQPLYLPLIR